MSKKQQKALYFGVITVIFLFLFNHLEINLLLKGLLAFLCLYSSALLIDRYIKTKKGLGKNY